MVMSTIRILLSLFVLATAWTSHPNSSSVFVKADNNYSGRECGGTIRHVHLSVGSDPSSEMTVSFSSKRSFVYNTPVIGGVLIGTSSDKLDIYVEEQEPARHYNATPLKAEHGHYYSPYQHHITITGLEPSMTYYYKCVVREQGQRPPITEAALRSRDGGDEFKETEREIFEEKSQEEEEDQTRHRLLKKNFYDSSNRDCPPPHRIRKFVTAPKQGTTNTQQGTLKFAYIGDIGQFYHSIDNVRHLAKHQRTSISAIMLAGDIAYTGYDSRRWDTFFDFMDDHFIIDEVPMQVCAGNHDIDKQAEGVDIFMAYEARFRMPQINPAELGTYNGPSGHLDMDQPPYPLPYEWGNAYYAFTYGISRHIFLNAYSSMEPESTQYQWLLHELRSVNRSQTPWLLVTMHVPMYNTFDTHRHDKHSAAAKKNLEALFVKYTVNIVVSGHVHAYLRTKTVNENGVYTPKGPMHVVVGAGGRDCWAAYMSEEPEPYIAERDSTRYGYGTLQLYNKTHAKWRWIPTGYSDHQSVNEVLNTNVTFPPLKHVDHVVLENQYFLEA